MDILIYNCASTSKRVINLWHELRTVLDLDAGSLQSPFLDQCGNVSAVCFRLSFLFLLECSQSLDRESVTGPKLIEFLRKLKLLTEVEPYDQ